MEAVLIVLGLIVGCILMYFVLRPKLKAVKEYDKQIEEHNQRLRNENNVLYNRVEDAKK